VVGLTPTVRHQWHSVLGVEIHRQAHLRALLTQQFEKVVSHLHDAFLTALAYYQQPP